MARLQFDVAPDSRLQGNGLTALPTTVFDDMTRVENLQLKRNAITMLQPGLFAATTNVDL